MADVIGQTSTKNPAQSPSPDQPIVATSTSNQTTPPTGSNASRPFFRRLSRSRSKGSPLTLSTSASSNEKSVTTTVVSNDGGTFSNGGCVSEGTAAEPKGDQGAAKAKGAKLTALEKLKSLGGKRGKKEKKMEFPPSSWGLKENDVSIDAGSAKLYTTTTPPAESSVSGTPLGASSDLKVDGATAGVATPGATTTKTDGAAADPPEESITLARRIQALLATMPLFSSAPNTPDPSKFSNRNPNDLFDRTAKPTDTAAVGSDGMTAEDPPPPPSTSTSAMINDSRLMSLLSSAAIMNGSISKGKESVFAALDRLGIYSDRSRAASESVSGAATPTQDVIPDDSSDLMLYGPLIPEQDSKVEIARSEIISLEDDEDAGKVAGAEDGKVNSGKGKGKAKATEPSEDETKKGDGKKVKGKEKVVWVPSATKISLQCTWWGYRIFLPPPVLVVLNSKQFEAAKRAAIITTALKWILDHVPIKLLPPQFRPAMMLARRLVPLLGYIGTFIAWSWGAVRAFDEGNGVVLSATWLMPVAVIPGTWEADEFPEVHAASTSPTTPKKL